MPIVRVDGFSVSIDGFAAGPGQDADNPLGRGGLALHDWLFSTADPVDAGFATAGTEDVGAWIMGRNMFGPQRGPWPDESWRGWWGEEPPFHAPVFVLTHHPRPALEMRGGTVFHFVADEFGAVLSRARDAARERDVRIGGGVATLRRALAERLVDRLHLVQVPVLLGRGESLFAGLDLPALGYRVVRQARGIATTHIVMERT